MAKFRNVDKRRPWESPQQKRARRVGEAILMEVARLEIREKLWHQMGCRRFDVLNPRVALCYQEGPAYCAAVENPGAIKKCPKGFAILTPNRAIPFPHVSKVAKTEVSAPRTVRKETWREFFGLYFYRLRCWLREFWAAARFQRVGAWLPADRR